MLCRDSDHYIEFGGKSQTGECIIFDMFFKHFLYGNGDKLFLTFTENQNGHADKEVPSWLDKSPLRKTHAMPLQDTSNNQSINDGQSDMSNPEDSGKCSSRSSNSPMGLEIENDKKKTSLSIGICPPYLIATMELIANKRVCVTNCYCLSSFSRHLLQIVHFWNPLFL